MATTRVSSGGSQSAFARIASLAVGSKKKAEDDEDMKKAEDKDDDEDEKASDKDDDGSDNDEKKGKKKAKAADDKDDENCAEDDDKKDDDKASEKDDDEDEDDGAKKKAVRSARVSERRRISAILTSSHAMASEQHYANAAYLAFETEMSSSEAIGMLMCMPVAAPADSGKSKSNAARERLANTPNPKITNEGETKVSLADQIVLAGKKRRGEV